MDITINNQYDVAVLGAGAAGLVAAIRAAEHGRKVVLLEKNRKPGVKILASGGTRCNLTNARGMRSLHLVSGPIDPAYNVHQGRGARSIQQAFTPEAGAFLGPALKAFSVEDSVALFESEGVPTKIEANGKVFPASDRATDVLDALMRRLIRSGGELRPHFAVREVVCTENGFVISSNEDSVHAEHVIVTTGGQSYPGCGTTGDGYAIAERFGHTIIEPRPALVPVQVAAEWVCKLSGMTLPDVTVRVIGPGGAVLQERREAVLFAHFGLTGPAILDISRAVSRCDQPRKLVLALDLLPNQKAVTVNADLQAACRKGGALVANLLPPGIPRQLAEQLVIIANVPADRRGPELTRDERRWLVGTIKDLRIPLAGTLGFAKAEVTSGGVSLAEVDPATLESRLQPGLFFAGEVLDLDGLIGGYNFQAAWSTGWLAGARA